MIKKILYYVIPVLLALGAFFFFQMIDRFDANLKVGSALDNVVYSSIELIENGEEEKLLTILRDIRDENPGCGYECSYEKYIDIINESF